MLLSAVLAFGVAATGATPDMSANSSIDSAKVKTSDNGTTKNLKTIRINTTKSFKVQKGAFNGISTKKMTIKVSKKMSDKQYAKFQKTLKKAGYNGKVTRSIK